MIKAFVYKHSTLFMDMECAVLSSNVQYDEPSWSFDKSRASSRFRDSFCRDIALIWLAGQLFVRSSTLFCFSSVYSIFFV